METIILQLPNIQGNSTITGYAGQIILLSFSHGVHMPMGADVGGTERTLGRPSFSEMTLMKATDQSTPALYGACAGGTKLGNATITIGRNEAGVFMQLVQYVLTNAMIASISTSGSGTDAMDSISIHFSAITMAYTQQKTDSTQNGVASFGWDIGLNAATGTNQAISSS